MKKFLSVLSLALLTMSAWAANTYVKVTSVDQLEAGKNYILVNEEANVALGEITGTSTNFGSTVAITITDGVIDIEGTDVVELISGEGSIDQYGNPTWTFNMGSELGHYMCWASGNSLNTVNSAAPNNAMWLASLTDDGVVLNNKADNTRKLQYNAGAPRFACYTSTQKPAVLYIQGEPEEEGITTLAQANALADNESFTFGGNAVVTACKNGYVFLRDESGYGQINGVENAAFENGQVLSSGWTATKITIVDPWVRYIDAAGLSDSGETNAELAAAQKLTAFPDETMLNAYVLIEKTTISSGGGFGPGLPGHGVKYSLPDGSKISETQTLWAFDGEAGSDLYNVYGIVCKDGNTLKIQPVKFELYEEPQGLRGDVNDDHEIDINDVTLLIDVVLGVDVEYSAYGADCNIEDGDGTVDINDVTALINRVLTGEWE